MLDALIYLRLATAKNWLLARVRRLRQPKYLLGGIVGVAYFYFFFFRGFAGSSGRGTRSAQSQAACDAAAAALTAEWLPMIAALAALALLGLLALMWIVPTGPAALGFSEAEIAFLFPAPITRRALVHFRLISAQFRSLLGAALMMLFSNRWSALGGNPLTHAVGWWFIFSTLSLHQNAAGFTLTRLIDRGIGTWRRRALVIALLAAVVAASAIRSPLAWPPVGEGLRFDAVAKALVALGSAPPLSWLLAPLRLVLAPFFAPDSGAFLAALAPALAVITLHYLWVVRTAVSFEDATIEHAQKRAARVAAWRAGDRRFAGGPAKNRKGPFRLASSGRPELAFLWKNLLSTWPYFTVRVFAITAFVIAAACAWIGTQPYWRPLLPGVGAFAMIFAIYVLLVGPQFARQDIRADLPNTDILKTYPLAGWQIILGQLLTPAAILTGILWLAVLTIALVFHPGTAAAASLTPAVRFIGAVSLAAITPPVVLLQLLVPNAAALLFPGWFQASRGRGGGPEVIGQRMIFFFAQLLTMIFALLPAVGVAAVLLFALQWIIGTVAAMLVAAAMVLVVLLGEVWCGVWWLGRRFEKLDLSSELRS